VKGIILVGGLGTRLHPMTKVTNKHLLPVAGFPMVYYPLHSLVEAGIRDIMIVTGGNNPGAFLELLHDGREFGLEHLYFTYQANPAGIADALRARRADTVTRGARPAALRGPSVRCRPAYNTYHRKAPATSFALRRNRGLHV